MEALTFWGQMHTFLLPQPSPQGALPSPGTPFSPLCLGPPVAASAVCQVPLPHQLPPKPP
ncbi:rCG59966 [Rattus norvegicus]|uniref:RCG59966 n=1 Tax=Rattus norvegicus TaxID=10116 RepID=A6HQU2_RAT|nr:rCG59966 [Rattus norvegicus]